MSRFVRITSPLAAARLLVAAAALLVTALPNDAHAQGLFGRMKQAAKERAATAAARAATSAVQKSGQVADTALGAGVTSVDSVSGRAVGAASTAVSRVQGLLPGALGGKSATAAPTATSGVAAAPNGPSAGAGANAASAAAAAAAFPVQNVSSVPLHGAVFIGSADTLDTVAISYLRQLTPRLRELGSRWTVVATVTPTADRSRDQARADRRALSVKSALVASGMTPGDIEVLGRVAPLAPDAPVGGVILTRQR